jgi:hypothetical protein
VATIFVRRTIGEARYRSGVVDNVSSMSIETEEELDALRRAGAVVAEVLRELRRRCAGAISSSST